MAREKNGGIEDIKSGYGEKYGFHDKEGKGFRPHRGLSKEVVQEISVEKGEPSWMLKRRLEALTIFQKKPNPTWGANLFGIDFENMYYYFRTAENNAQSWDDVDPDQKKTFDRLGIPEAEQKFLAGVGAQYDSEVVYHSLKVELERQGVIFESTDQALRNHPEFFKRYFGTVIPSADNKYAALNTAVWSGGSFIYVPPGVHIEQPLQAYFRINAKNVGQFERTLIFVDEGASVHYVEGCTAPIYSSDSLHSAVVEIIVKKGGKCRYTTIQNWSTNVYNLVTKRATVEEGGSMEWVDANIGSKVTMKYPSIYLLGDNSHGKVLSAAFAGKGQNLDAGGKIIHAGKNTTGEITSKSISMNGGRATYRGLVQIEKGARGSKSFTVCDALLMDDQSRTDTYPSIKNDERDAQIGHEASVTKVNEEAIIYARSRGISVETATAMIVQGFIEPIARELPLEYSIELYRLLQLQMEGSVG